jgi:uncharacterized protein
MRPYSCGRHVSVHVCRRAISLLGVACRPRRSRGSSAARSTRRLLDASGNELIITVEPRRQRPTIDAVRALRDEIVAAVGRFGGTNVRVFGSVARGTASDVSDVDLLIDVPAGTGLIGVEQITEAVASVVPWPVDVVTSGAARRRMAHVLDEAVPL